MTKEKKKEPCSWDLAKHKDKWRAIHGPIEARVGSGPIGGEGALCKHAEKLLCHGTTRRGQQSEKNGSLVDLRSGAWHDAEVILVLRHWKEGKVDSQCDKVVVLLVVKRPT